MFNLSLFPCHSWNPFTAEEGEMTGGKGNRQGEIRNMALRKEVIVMKCHKDRPRLCPIT